MSALTETAYAKINLALHVRQRRGDGYHAIESVFAFAVEGDRLEASIREDAALTLVIDGPFADGLAADESNLVLRAGMALQEASGTARGADIRLTKNLPIASGIGGGSADAAATLRLLDRLWGCALGRAALLDLALPLGSDVPACLLSHTLFAGGRGEDMTPLDLPGLSQTPVLLVNPLVPCATGPVFRGWDGADRGALDPHRWREGRNDLEAPARALAPQIGEVLQWLAVQPGVALVRMSGSGATCFALGEAPALAGAAAACRARGWWSMETALR